MTARLGTATFLGTATSHGVPMIGCTCEVCRSADPRDHRSRPSVYLEMADGTTLLVDTTPDLRRQALTYGVTRVDTILLTHCHADHVMGLDDVRRFNVLQGCAIPCYGDARTMQEIRRVFAYIFESADSGGGIPQIELRVTEGPFQVGATTVVPVPIRHGSRLASGYRLGNFAYLTDCNGIPDTSWSLLEGLDTLVIDALRHRPHPSHFTVAEAVAVAARLQPRQTWLTHICHDLGHAVTEAQLPTGVNLAYDGLQVAIVGTAPACPS